MQWASCSSSTDSREFVIWLSVIYSAIVLARHRTSTNNRMADSVSPTQFSKSTSKKNILRIMTCLCNFPQKLPFWKRWLWNQPIFTTTDIWAMCPITVNWCLLSWSSNRNFSARVSWRTTCTKWTHTRHQWWRERRNRNKSTTGKSINKWLDSFKSIRNSWCQDHGLSITSLKI